MDFHIITPHGPELVMQVVDGQLVVPQPSAPAVQDATPHDG